jgi:hypothetical protein
MNLVPAPRDLAALRLILTAWTRTEYHGRGGNRMAQQLAILDMKELWRVELVGWGAESGMTTAAGGFPTGA